MLERSADLAAAFVDCRQFGYKPDESWLRLPAGMSWMEVAGVATDRRQRVYVFNRGPDPVMIFERDGRFIESWGQGLFVRPHGITIGPDDAVYCTDDMDHTVRKFSPAGELLLTLGTSGKGSNTGAMSLDYRTIRHSGPPFHYPTNVALGGDGSIYVSDGYGNARIHKFSPNGELLVSWGEPGAGPGEFHVPHGLAIDEEGIVYVADRENSRIQLFSAEGNYLRAWTNVARPSQVFIDKGLFYIAELGFRAGMWPGTSPPTADATGGRVSIFDRRGELVARWGGGVNPTAPGDFFAPHGICVDSRADIYVCEVVMSAGGNRGLVAADCHALQKFARGVPA